MKPIYQDDNTIAYLSPTPAVAGHVIISPRKKYTILEEVPEEVTGQLFVVANKISSILFETLGAHGTNTIIQNGEAAGQEDATVQVHLIPRKEQDGLDFRWQPETIDEEKNSVAELNLRDACKRIIIGKKEEKKEVREEEAPQEVANTQWVEKALFRIP